MGSSDSPINWFPSSRIWVIHVERNVTHDELHYESTAARQSWGTVFTGGDTVDSRGGGWQCILRYKSTILHWMQTAFYSVPYVLGKNSNCCTGKAAFSVTLAA